MRTEARVRSAEASLSTCISVKAYSVAGSRAEVSSFRELIHSVCVCVCEKDALFLLPLREIIHFMKRSSLLVVALLSCAHAASPRLAPTLRKKLHTLSGGVVHTDSFEELEPIPHEAAPTGPTIAVDDDVPTFQEKLIGELVGTFLLTLAVACVSAQDLPAPTVCGSFAVASILTGLIYGFGPLSGAIFNPAVSVALMIRGRMDATTAFAFAVVETIGAMLAGLAGAFIYGKSIAPSIADPSSTLGWLRAGLAEILFTGTIIQVVLHSGTTKAQEKNNVVGLAIGLTVFGCAVCSAVSGSVFNPAIGTGLWIAKAVTKGGFSLENVVLYLLAPSVGAALSTGAFIAARPREP